MSVGQLAANIVHALSSDATGAVTLPAQHLTMAALVAAVGQVTKADPALAAYLPDAEIEAGFGRYPQLSTPQAASLGFRADADLDALVTSALATID